MNIAISKHLNEIMPYWMKRPFAGFIRDRLIKNRIFLEQYALLTDAESWTEDEIKAYQMKELQRVLLHAYRHTAYYRELFDKAGVKPEEIRSPEDLKKLPVLTKEMLIENCADMQADDIDNYYEMSTGGTTGKAVHVLMENDAVYREFAFVYHFWSKFGYDYASSRLATFRGVDLGGRTYVINPLNQEIRMNVFQMNRENIREYVRIVDRFKADFIYGYPSSIYNFCRLAQGAGIELKGRFRAALLISENLYEFQENMIHEVLACPIGMFYGHSERAVFAEKYDIGYQFQPLYGITEIDEDGSPVATGFINGKTPLIRYKIDDHVQKIPGGQAERYAVTGHRNSEVVYGTNGQQFRATMLDFHGMISSRLTGFQFVQEAPGELTLRVLKENDCPEEIERIRLACGKKLGEGSHVRVEMVDSLDSGGGYTNTGFSARKYRLLDQRYSPDRR